MRSGVEGGGSSRRPLPGQGENRWELVVDLYSEKGGKRMELGST